VLLDFQSHGLVDHLVGAAGERQWDREAECLGGLEVDDQLDFCGLLDRKIGGPLALENPTAVEARQLRAGGHSISPKIRSCGLGKLADLVREVPTLD